MTMMKPTNCIEQLYRDAVYFHLLSEGFTSAQAKGEVNKIFGG